MPEGREGAALVVDADGHVLEPANTVSMPLAPDVKG